MKTTFHVRLFFAFVLAFCCSSLWAAGGNAAPKVTLVSPAGGSTFLAPATVQMEAAAYDTDGSIARVEFYRGTTLLGTSTAAPYRFTWANVASGTYSVTAKAIDNAGGSATSTAASITVFPPTGSPNISITSPANGTTVYTDTVTVSGTFIGGTSNVTVDNGASSRLATLSGNSFTATVPLQLGTNTLTVTVAHADKSPADLAPRTVVRNSAPLVVLTSPPTLTFYAPANIALAADAVSPAGTIDRVSFYRNGALLGTSTAPPYQFDWANVPAGSYAVSATAWDTAGQSSSTSVTVTVKAPNLLPAVNITSPAAGTTFNTPANITIQASAIDSDGSIANVEFLQNGQVLGVTNLAPYSFAWNNVPAGAYTLTARATDDAGAVATSPGVSVTVKTLPPVEVTSPAPGATFVAPAAIALAANTSSSSLGVSFYQRTATGDVLIGESTNISAPYTYNWIARTPGTYNVVARTLSASQPSQEYWSEPVAITVAANPDGEVVYLHNDFAGSAIASTDVNGGVLWKENYRPYGDRLVRSAAGANERLAFHAKELDADTGLQYFGARYFDPTLGRFMGVDSVLFKEDNLHSFNRYAYGNNNPHRFVDPDGNEPVEAYRGGYNRNDVRGGFNARGESLVYHPDNYNPSAASKALLTAALIIAPEVALSSRVAAATTAELSFGRKLDFLFNKNIDKANTYNAARAAGNAERIGIADTAANRAEVIRRFNEAYRDATSIVGSGKVPGSNLREFFLPGITGTGSKVQFVEKAGEVITIMAK